MSTTISNIELQSNEIFNFIKMEGLYVLIVNLNNKLTEKQIKYIFTYFNEQRNYQISKTSQNQIIAININYFPFCYLFKQLTSVVQLMIQDSKAQIKFMYNYDQQYIYDFKNFVIMSINMHFDNIFHIQNSQILNKEINDSDSYYQNISYDRRQSIKELSILIQYQSDDSKTVQELSQTVLDIFFSQVQIVQNRYPDKDLYLIYSIEEKIYTDEVLSNFMLKFQQEDIEYVKQKELILEQLSTQNIMEILDINNQFKIPEMFEEAINEIEKIQYQNSPRLKLKHITMMRTIFKKHIFRKYNSKKEIESMDDELPLIIYTVLQSNIENIIGEIQLLNEIVNIDYYLESDQQIIINLIVSVKFIQNQDNWIQK